MLTDNLNKVVRDLINEGLKISNYAIKADQNAPRPTGQYCAVKLFNTESIGNYDLIETPNADDDTDIDHEYQFIKNYIFDLNLYRDNSQNKANILANYFKTPIANNKSSENGVKIISVNDVTNITEPLSSGYEFRSNIQLTISIVDSYKLEKVGVIESLEIDNQVNNEKIEV